MKAERLRNIAVCAVLILAAACAAPAGASPGGNAVIDAERKASLTFVKVRENSGAMIETGGRRDDPPGAEKMSGVRFGALRIAGMETVTDADGTGTYFTGLDASFAALLAENGVRAASVSKGGRTCYTADALQEALAELNAVPGDVPGGVLINRFVKNHSGTRHSPETGADGAASLDNLPQGLYLVAEESRAGSAAGGGGDSAPEVFHNISDPLLVSLPMTDPADGASWMYDVTVYPKNQTVRIPKYIVSADDGDTLRETEDLEIGQRVREIIVSGVPAVQRTGEGERSRDYESYEVTDTMEKGLSFAELISVRLGAAVSGPEKLGDFSRFAVLASGRDYELLHGESGAPLTSANAAGCGSFRVKLLDAGLDRLNALKGEGQLLVEFEAVVTRGAEDGNGKIHTNKPRLTVKNANTEAYTVGGNEPGIFTYRIRLKKNGVSDASKVTFAVARDGKTLKFVKEKPGIYHPWDADLDRAEGEPAAEDVSPAPDGTLTLRGLDADTYQFTEKTTESGHELLKSSFRVELRGSSPPDGNLREAILRTEDGSAALTVSRGTAGLAVDNMRSIILRTGGRGVKAYYMGALLLFIPALLPFMAGRKKEERKGRK